MLAFTTVVDRGYGFVGITGSAPSIRLKPAANRGGTNAQHRSDLSQTVARCQQEARLIGVESSPPPADLPPFGACVAHPRPYPLLNQRTLELGHGSDDVEHQAPRGRAEVQVILQGDKRDA